MHAALVVVHGEPGAGKSTLARAVGIELTLPVFDRDDFKDQMFDKLGWSDRDWSGRVGAASWDMLVMTIERLVTNRVSTIAESNFRPTDPGLANIAELCRRSEVRPVEIYCTAPPEVLWTRFDERGRRGDRHPGHVGYEDFESFAAALAARPHGPLGLGGPSLEIDTGDMWPDPVDVAEWIRSQLDD